TPRVSEYGGLIDMAAFILVNSGLASFAGRPHLEVNDEESDGDFSRGRLVLRLKGGDSLQIGVDGIDVLVVQYIREGQVVYARRGLIGVTVKDAVGSIAAALVRIAEIDTVALKSSRKRSTTAAKN